MIKKKNLQQTKENKIQTSSFQKEIQKASQQIVYYLALSCSLSLKKKKNPKTSIKTLSWNELKEWFTLCY